MKRALDLTVSLAALVVMAPVLAVIAVAVRLSSPGPALFRQSRLGLRGRPFELLKFRSMQVNCADLRYADGSTLSSADDPRVTALGRFLRRTSLDELPQLWNVLRGEMSLVGPRPHPLDDFAQYRLDHFRRLDVTPGITGLWQITARRDPSFQRTMALDLEYIEGWSLMVDLRILFKTVFVIFQGSGA